MIITAPFRRMILHRSQRGFMEVRIFMAGNLYCARCDSLFEVLWLRLRTGGLIDVRIFM